MTPITALIRFNNMPRKYLLQFAIVCITLKLEVVVQDGHCFPKQEIFRFRRAVVKFSIQCSELFHNEIIILNIVRVEFRICSYQLFSYSKESSN